MPPSTSFWTQTKTSLVCFRRLVPVDRRIDDRVVHERHRFLRAFVPSPSVIGVRAVVFGVAAQGVGVGGLVVRGAAHPAIGQARPFGDRTLRGDQFLTGPLHPEVFVRVAAGAGVGRAGQRVAPLRIMQRIVQPGDRADGIAESRMGGDVGDTLAIDIDLASVAQALDVFRPGVGPALVGDDVFRTHAVSPWFVQASIAEHAIKAPIPHEGSAIRCRVPYAPHGRGASDRGTGRPPDCRPQASTRAPHAHLQPDCRRQRHGKFERQVAEVTPIGPDSFPQAVSWRDRTAIATVTADPA